MKTREQVRVHIRHMIRRDMPEVLAIEALSFEDLWLEDDFLNALQARNCLGMVAEDSREKVVGFMVYALQSEHIRLLRFAVHPSFWNVGIGSQMIAKLKSRLATHRRTRLIVDVPERDLATQVFFRDCRFEATCVLREEEAYRMEFRLEDV